MTRILVVDDDAQITRALRINLKARGYEVDTAADGTSALHAASHTPPPARLRRKLEADPARPRHLLTEPGMGYRFRP